MENGWYIAILRCSWLVNRDREHGYRALNVYLKCVRYLKCVPSFSRSDRSADKPLVGSENSGGAEMRRTSSVTMTSLFWVVLCTPAVDEKVWHFCFLTPGVGAKYCDERVCLSVCSQISKTCPNLTKFSVVYMSSDDNNAIRCVFLVLRIMGYMARG